MDDRDFPSRIGPYAIEDASAAIAMDASLLRAWYARTWAKEATGDRDGARVDYRAALSKAPGDWDLRADTEKAMRRLE